MLHPLILVALGGALGSMARYGLSSLMIRQLDPFKFPWPTFCVNVLGCLRAGLFLAVSERGDGVSAETRLLVVTGLLGGFTTFSAFGMETLSLIRRGDLLMALSYVSLSVIMGLCAMWLAYALMKLVLA